MSGRPRSRHAGVGTSILCLAAFSPFIVLQLIAVARCRHRRPRRVPGVAQRRPLRDERRSTRQSRWAASPVVVEAEGPAAGGPPADASARPFSLPARGTAGAVGEAWATGLSGRRRCCFSAFAAGRGAAAGGSAAGAAGGSATGCRSCGRSSRRRSLGHRRREEGQVNRRGHLRSRPARRRPAPRSGDSGDAGWRRVPNSPTPPRSQPDDAREAKVSGAERTYRFPARDRTGLLLGLQAAQCAILGAGVLISGVLLNLAAPAPVVLGVAAGAVVIAFAPVAGRPGYAWLPVATGWVLGGRSGRTWTCGSSPPSVCLPDKGGGRRRGSRSGLEFLAGIELHEHPGVQAGSTMAVVTERRSGGVAGLRVAGRGVPLIRSFRAGPVARRLGRRARCILQGTLASRRGAMVRVVGAC